MTFFALCKTTMAVTSFPSRQAPQLYQWELGSTSKSRQLKGFAFSVYTRLWKMDLFLRHNHDRVQASARQPPIIIFNRPPTTNFQKWKQTGNFFFTESDRITFFNIGNDFFETKTQKNRENTRDTVFEIFHENFKETKKLNEEASDWSNSVGRDSRWD